MAGTPNNTPQPPAPGLPFVQIHGDGNGYLTVQAFQMLQYLFTSVGGGGGLIDVSLLFVNEPLYRETSPAPILWTPVLRGSTTAGGHSYTRQWGWAAQVGPGILAMFDIQLSGNDLTNAGDVQIAGLPFAAATSPGSPQAGYLSSYRDVVMATGQTQLGVQVGAGAKVFTLEQSAPEWAGQPLPASGLTTTSGFTGGAFYFR